MTFNLLFLAILHKWFNCVFSSARSKARRSCVIMCPLNSLRWSSSAYAHYLGEACCFLALLHTHCGYRGSERVGMRELHWLIHPRMNHCFSWDIGVCVCVCVRATRYTLAYSVSRRLRFQTLIASLLKQTAVSFPIFCSAS